MGGSAQVQPHLGERWERAASGQLLWLEVLAVDDGVAAVAFAVVDVVVALVVVEVVAGVVLAVVACVVVGEAALVTAMVVTGAVASACETAMAPASATIVDTLAMPVIERALEAAWRRLARVGPAGRGLVSMVALL